jgi:hypothetical protein
MTRADLLWPHMTSASWVDVAEVARPGLRSKVAAVIAGTATTVGLPVQAAVRVLESLPFDARAGAARGDRRAAVTALAGVASTPSGPSDPTRAAHRLFDGTPDEVAARLAERSKVTSATVDAFCSCDDGMVAALAAKVLTLAPLDAAARVVAEVSDRGLAGGVVGLVRAVEAQDGPGNRWLRHHRIYDGVATLLAANGVDVRTRQPRPLVTPDCDATATAAQLADLVAAGLLLRMTVCTSSATARAAVQRIGADLDALSGRPAVVTAGLSGLEWESVAAIARKGAPSARLSICASLAAAGVPTAFLDAAVCDLFTEAQEPGWVGRAGRDVIAATGPDLPTIAGLKLLLDIPKEAKGVPQQADQVFTFLGGGFGHRCDPEVVADVLDGRHGEPLARALRACARQQPAAITRMELTGAQSCAAALAPMWREFVHTHFGDRPLDVLELQPVGTVLAGAVAVVAGDLEAAVNTAGGGADLWSAVLSLADGFDGPLDELVACASGVLVDA